MTSLCYWAISKTCDFPVLDQSFNTLDDFDVNGQSVLVRADLNVPLTENREITDDTRIKRLVPTLAELSARGARTIVMSHFGRPKGKFD